MITAKQLKDTYPHRQMRMYIDELYGDLIPRHRAPKLAALVKKFLFNTNNERDGIHMDQVPNDIDEAFTWEDTPEGFQFWCDLHNNYKPEFIVEVVKPVKAKAPKKRVGWWA